jgi:HAD superfamily hydrolase (TIGR01509 family)
VSALQNALMQSWCIEGRVVTGAGQGAGFTQLDWARTQFIEQVGIDPYPGTLNLLLDAASSSRWNAVRVTAGRTISPPPGQGCTARCIPVRIAGRLPGAIIVPDVAGYDLQQVEVIAAVPLRLELGLDDGADVELAGVTAPAIQLAVFDVDGTLVNSIEGMTIAADRAARALGYRVNIDMVRRALSSDEPLWDIVAPPRSRIDPDLPARLRRDTLRHYSDVLESSVEPFEGLAASLARLREAGVRLAIYTGSRGESFRPLQKAGLLEWFDPVLTALDVTRPKPHPEGLQRILEQSGVAAGEAAYVGDSPHDMLAGRAAGMRTVGVLTGVADSALLSRAGADHLVADHRGWVELLLGVAGSVVPGWGAEQPAARR